MATNTGTIPETVPAFNSILTPFALTSIHGIEMDMKCPQCRKHLVTLEFEQIEVDYCTACKGIWLDSGELEYLLSREGEPDPYLAQLVPSPAREKRKRCPVCTVLMDKVSTGHAERILLDQCPLHGIWFDRGELRSLIRAGRTGDGAAWAGPVVLLLDEMFPSLKDE